MTVGELIKILEDYDKNLRIMQSNEMFYWDIEKLSKSYDEELCEQIVVLG